MPGALTEVTPMKTYTLSTIKPASLLLLMALMGFVAAPSLFAQSFSLGTDLVSRYVWRGADFGESASLQPSLAFETKGFEIGTWASYSIAPDGAGANEHDLWISYTIETRRSGSFSLGATDYYFPAPDGSAFFDFSGSGEGSHWIEPFVRYTGPAVFPVTLSGAVFVHNDPDHSVYLEAGLPVRIDGVVLGLTAGAVANRSTFYGTDGFALVNLGLSATKGVALSEQFSLPVDVAYILNPDQERSFLVIGFRISL